MALFQISNDKITIQVDSMGAELKSLKEVASDREYPVDRIRGRSFVKDMEFKLKSQVAHEIWFVLESDEDTLAKYPYPFVLEIGYELAGDSVVVKWRVRNPAKETMYFTVDGREQSLEPDDIFAADDRMSVSEESMHAYLTSGECRS